MSKMTQHFVTFYSPGIFVFEQTTKPILAWDVEVAKQMACGVLERYSATPYAFRFLTKTREDDESGPKVTATSPLYYIGGKVETLEEVEVRATKDDQILLSNMRSHGYKKIITTTKGWKLTQPLNDSDIVLEYDEHYPSCWYYNVYLSSSSMGDEPCRAVRMEGSPINQQLQSGPLAEMPTSPTQSHSLPRESPEADTLVIGPTDGSRACRSSKPETYGASETSDRERARKIIFEMHEREGEDAIVEWIAAIRAGQPRLTAEDVQKVAYKLLLPERTLEWSERTAERFAELANAILDAKSGTPIQDMQTGTPGILNAQDTPQAAWKRAFKKAAGEIDREVRWRVTERDDSGNKLESGYMRPINKIADDIRALADRYEPPK